MSRCQHYAASSASPVDNDQVGKPRKPKRHVLGANWSILVPQRKGILSRRRSRDPKSAGKVPETRTSSPVNRFQQSENPNNPLTSQLNIKLPFLRGRMWNAGFAIGGAIILTAAQTTRTDPVSAQTESAEAKPKLPTPAQVSAAPADEKKEEVVKPSPLTVHGEAPVGYQAKTTMAATRLRTNVGDVDTILQIVPSQCLMDTGATIINGTHTANLVTSVRHASRPNPFHP
jgi:hypothetical protein